MAPQDDSESNIDSIDEMANHTAIVTLGTNFENKEVIKFFSYIVS